MLFLTTGKPFEFAEARTKLTTHHFVMATPAELSIGEQMELAGLVQQKAVELSLELTGAPDNYMVVRNGAGMARVKATHWHIAVMSTTEEKVAFLIGMAERNKSK